MEEEIHYATVVFRNSGDAPKVKKEEPPIHFEAKPKGSSTPVQTSSCQADGEAAARCHFRVLVACSGVLCVLLVASISAIVYISVVLKEQRANHSELTAENQQLIVERNMLEREAKELSRVTENLNWTLGVILKFNTFPVNDYCPDKKCQPCQEGWIQFQEKCYLFYNEKAPWKTWQESRTYCQKTTADLVVIDSLHEQEFISNHTEYYYDNFHGFWLGLLETKDNIWVWVDGRNDTLGYWMMKEQGTPGPCALMIPGRDLTASWDPANCVMRNKFICEIDALIKSN
ncbi:killer cell lectin-like receptor subfamily F member 1 [Centropristis striata]|uniref:killer cell lectin-like receptor subfamily F member 1 n=1 Tax=Centropristis striata TaxID=184440 RepID=UPI0027E158B2|nr:killer cell lectin-like receptor subfamily F member 1 [Centropristis striata]